MIGPSSSPDITSLDERENQLRYVTGVFNRYWRLIFLFALCTSLLYGGFGLFLSRSHRPPTYEAIIDLEIRRSPWDASIPKTVSGTNLLSVAPADIIKQINTRVLAGKVAGELSNMEHDAVESPLASLIREMEKLKGTPAASPAEARAPAPHELSAAELFSALKIDTSPTENGIRLAVRGDVRARTERLCKASAKVIAGLNRERLAREIEETSQFLKTELTTLRSSLDDAESAQWKFLQENGLSSYEETTRQIRERNEQLMEAKAAKPQLLERLRELSDNLKESTDQLPQAISQITDTVIVQLLGELEDLRKKELAMEIVYQTAYPPLQELKDEIAEKEQTLLEAINRYENGTNPGQSAWDEIQQLRRDYAQAQLELKKTEDRIVTLQTYIDNLFKELPAFASNSHGYDQVVREVEGLRNQYEMVLNGDFQFRSAVRAGVGQLEYASDPSVTLIPPEPVKYAYNFPIGAFVGFLIGLGLSLMLDAMDTSIKSADDIAQYLHLTVIGTIPRMKFLNKRKRVPPPSSPGPANHKNVAQCIVTVTDPKSPISEAYRTLRTNFQFCAAVQRHVKTVMITSAVPGEGKTTTTINFGITLAAQGLRVLLVDADMRRPNLHQMLRMERTPGLSEVLAGECPPHEAIKPSGLASLWVLPSGHLPSNPSEMLASHKMSNLLSDLGREYDIVLCDVPSVIVVTDAVLLANKVDAVIMVVSVCNARRKTIQRAVELLKTVGNCFLAGVVLNGLKPSNPKYYYYYYYSEGRSKTGRRRWYHV